MNTPQDWVEEARLRLEDALSLLERGRPARRVSASYYAVHAGGKGLLLTLGVEISTHAGLRNRLSYHFVREGLLPDETDGDVEELYRRRLDADYELRRFTEREAREDYQHAQRYLDRFETLV